MNQATLLLSSSVASHTSTLGNSFAQFGQELFRRIATRSTKKIRPVHGQSAKQISVVISTCCRTSVLENCLQALVDQKFDKNFYEIIVVSDGPDGETKALVNSFRQFHPSIYYLHLPKKKGPAAARNLGWQRAWGKLIAFTDDDCLPDKNWLSCLYKTYKGESEIAYAGAVKIPLSSQSSDYKKNTSNLETPDFVTANCCCTKAALELVQGFDERFSMASREDSDLEFKLLEKGIPVVKVDDALVVHPVRDAKWSIKEQKNRIFNALLYKKFPQLYRKKIRHDRQWSHHAIAISFLCLLFSFYLHVNSLGVVFATFWAILTVNSIINRVLQTAKTVRHIMPIVATSIAIPFVSVYWQLYGAIKYRTLFL